MIRGVSAEAARQGIVAIDAATGEVVGDPQVQDLSEHRYIRCR